MLYDVLQDIQKSSDLLHLHDGHHHLLVQRVLHTMEECMACLQRLERTPAHLSAAVEKVPSEVSSLSPSSAAAAATDGAAASPTGWCAQFANILGILAAHVATCLVNGAPSGIEGTAGSVGVLTAMTLPQLCNWMMFCCESIMDVATHWMAAVNSSQASSSTAKSRPSGSSSSSAGSGLSSVSTPAMRLLCHLMGSEWNAYFWSRNFGAAALSVPSTTFCDALMLEVRHLEPMEVRCRVVATFVSDVVDWNHDGNVEVAELCVALQTTSLLKMLEQQAVEEKAMEAQLRRQREASLSLEEMEAMGWTDNHQQRRRDEAARSGGSSALSGTTPYGRCDSCRRLEAELVLARREIASLREQLLHGRLSSSAADGPPPRYAAPTRSWEAAMTTATTTTAAAAAPFTAYHAAHSSRASFRHRSGPLPSTTAARGGAEMTATTPSRHQPLSPRRESQRLRAAIASSAEYPVAKTTILSATYPSLLEPAAHSSLPSRESPSSSGAPVLLDRAAAATSPPSMVTAEDWETHLDALAPRYPISSMRSSTLVISDRLPNVVTASSNANVTYGGNSSVHLPQFGESAHVSSSRSSSIYEED